MKIIIILIFALLISVFTFGCTSVGEGPDYGSDNSDFEDISYLSDTSFDTTESESSVNPEEVYPFLSSKYVVTSRRESFGTVYECKYYLVDGKVAGAKLMTTLPDEPAALEYFETVLEDYPDATMLGLTVTHYLEDNMHFYYGSTLDKLKFLLDKSGYDFTVDFDEKVYNAEFNTSAG